MILGPISAIDCVAFVIFLVPQLFYHAGFFSTLFTVCQVLPFLAVQLPYQVVRERYLTAKEHQSPFVQRASVFQDVVVRCVRYAFANIPASIGRVFFSKWVAYPFFRFRLLRHGFLHCPMYHQEVTRQGVRGLWIVHDHTSDPDIIIYYGHGGGFSMGSSYFYLEFLMAWVTRLKERGFRNPAVFALEYTLVPDGQWPTQFNETRSGYQLLRETFGDRSARKICVSGDSAGGTLILSMLRQPGHFDVESPFQASRDRPALAILLSPWTHLVSNLNQNTSSDYLDKDSLHLYAKQYAGSAAATNEVVSPGLSIGRWKQVSPLYGYRIIYGAEEVFSPGIQEMVRHMRSNGAVVKVHREEAGIHAWPVVNLFLGQSRSERLRGVDIMTDFICSSDMAPNSYR